MATETITTTLSPDLHIVKTELYDPDVMEALLRDTKSFSQRDLRNLSRYKKGRKFGNTVEVIYHYGKGCERLRIGRLFAHDGQGLQVFPSDIRNPLLQKHYWDIDMENCHYWLMRQYCDWNGIPHDAISFYCDNREDCLKRVSSNRRVAKNAFLKVAYGGNIKLYDDLYSDDGIAPDGDVSVLKAVEKEIKVLIAWLKAQTDETHREIWTQAVKKTKNGKDGNTDFTYLALCLQTEECKCLLAMNDYFTSVGRSADILIHDGLEVRKLDAEREFPEELLRGAELAVKSKTGYSVKVAQKPITHNFKMPEGQSEVIDDEYASRVFVALMGDFIAREDDDVYFFNKQTGMWDNTETAYRTAVATNKAKLLFKVDDGIINYGGNEKNVNAMRKWIGTALPDTKFISRNADSSYAKLLFADGIYDFVDDTFTPGFDPTIVFNKRIDRSFPTQRNEALIREVKKVLFEDAFKDEDGLQAGEYLRKALCMGLLGDYQRKKFYFGLGESNCGKGVTTMAFSNSFGDYCASWDGNNLKYNSRNGQDEAKKLAWVKGMIGVRLAFANEMRMDKTPIDGNLLKALSSGGDEMKVRSNHKDEQKHINRATMFCLANDMLPITPNDSGIRERCRFIRYKLRFVAEPSLPDERKADPLIKTKFSSDDYKNALFHLMVDTFKEMRADEKKKGGQLETPLCVMEETKEWVGDGGNGDFADTIRRRYDITGNEEDSVPSREIVRYIVETCKMPLSDVKIGRELSKLIKTVNADCGRDRNPTGDEVGKQRLGIRRKEGGGVIE